MIRRLLPILLLLFCCPTIYAQSKQILPASGKHGGNGLYINGSGQNHLKIKANIGAISLNDTTTKKGDFIELQADGTYISGAEGEPQLPAFRKLVQMPVGAKPVVTIKHADTTFYALSDLGIKTKLSPRQPSQSKSDDKPKFKYKRRSYKRNYFTQNELVTVSTVGSMRGVGIGQVNVNPVRYNPKQNTLMVLSNIEFDVEFEGGTAKSSAKDGSPYFDEIYSTLGNYMGRKSDLTKYPVKYLIVTDTAFLGALSDFIKWKRQKGFDVVVATTDTLGKNVNDIKTWITTQYNSATYDSPAPSFLLLAADDDKIPTSQKGSSSGYGTDLYYACMDGNDDIIPDMYYGRFSARTAEQMKAIADKSITYEKYQFEDPSYLAKATLIAGYDDGGRRSKYGIPTVNYIANNRINNKNGYSKVNKYTTDYSGCYADSSVSVGLMNYTAHGSITTWVNPYLSKNDVNNFGNQGKFPFVIANCCLSGQFTKDECLGETWLRKANGGAVAYIGSSPESYWDEDFYWAVGAHRIQTGVSPDTSETTIGAFDAPFVSDFVCGGAIMYAGNLAVTEARDSNNYSGTKSSRYYWEGYNYLGDPSLLVFFGEAKENVVSHTASIPTSSTSVTVSALSGSYVAISYNGELLGAAYVPKGENSAVVTIKPINIPCDFDVVVTKPRYKPYFGTITTILPNESYLAITDNPLKNKSLQYGSSDDFDVVVNNLGQQPSQTATVSITSTSPLVTNVGASQTTINPIGGLSSCTIAGLCHIELAGNIADGTKIPFRFSVTENGRTTSNDFSLNVTAPKLKLNTTATIDKPEGRMFPGETADIIVNLMNNGHAESGDITVTLIPDDGQPMVEVIGNTQNISNLMPGESTICRFSIAADEYADMMTLFDFTIAATASQPLHSDSCHYTVTIGKLEDKIIGTGTSTAYYYPFYNYYKTSRTQILYTAADLGNKPIRIDEMAFQFSSITQVNSFGGFKDLTIKIKHYSSNDLEGLENFVDMSNAETVLNIDLMNLESKELNFKFDKPFEYNGKSNILMEIGWGQNINYIDKQDTPDIYCHTTPTSTIIYGLNDDADCPDDISKIKNYASKRPNTIFRYQKPKYVFIDAKDANGQPFAGVELIVDDDTLKTNNSGLANLLVYTNRQISYKMHSMEYLVEDESIIKHGDTTDIKLQLRQLNVHTATFHVVDSATLRNITNAQVSISGHSVMTDDYGWATFDRVPDTPQNYTVTANAYISANGTINVNSDTLLLVFMNVMPHVTFNVHTNKASAANIAISIGGTLLTTDSLGRATFYTTKTDTIPYTIFVGAQTLTDTIWNLQKSATVSIDLALIEAYHPADTTHNDTIPNDTTIIKPIHCSITFCLTDGSTPLADVNVSMNGTTQTTDSLGIVRFDSIVVQTPINYIISKKDYQTIDGQNELTGTFVLAANTSITITLKAVELPPPPVSVIENSASRIIVYPNPSDGLLYIQNADGQEFVLVDKNGRMLQTGTIESGQIDLRPIATGIYTLIIKHEGGISSTQVVVY